MKSRTYNLLTRIRIQKNIPTIQSGGFKSPQWIDVGNELPTDPPIIRYSEFVWLKLTNSLNSDSPQTVNEALVTIPYPSDPSTVNATCRIVEVASGIAYEIITSPSDVGQMHRYLQFKAQASVNDQ
jgi:hypothetical protein